MPALVTAPSSGKANHFGIEVVKTVTWKGWEPGQEYTKNIVLKNVRVKTQKLKYKVPQTRFFHTLYPQPIMLSAGTSFTLPVTFRPLDKKVYVDKIEFITNEGSFDVPIHADLPQYGINVPDNINFSLCATEDQVTLSFNIQNLSELVTPFLVDCEQPFTVEPPEGVLEPFGSFSLTASFKPKAAVVYEAEAVIRFGANYDQCKKIKFEGIGKFPHVLVACGGQPAILTPGGLESMVCFGEVPIGQTAEKWLELRNMSPVNAPFRVDHPTSQSRIDTVFSCPQKQGVVPANSTLRLPLMFTPNAVAMTSIDYLHVIPIGNISKTTIKCVGTSRGPKVRLSQKSINFLQVNAHYCATKTMEIINEADTPAFYQFIVDVNESVFKVSEPWGMLPPQGQKTLSVYFEPVQPINYYRKVACLVHNQGVVFLDLLGTCHTETCKPAVLQQRHIEQYEMHVKRGYSFTPPEQLNEMLKEGQLKLDQHGFIAKDGADQALTKLDPMDEYFNDGYYSEVTMTEPHVSLDEHEADFGQCADLRNVEQKTVNITNHTKGKISVAWTGDSSHVFSVSPPTADIPPLKSAPFTITFRPGVPNQFFGAELECYAYYKSMRDYRLVEDVTHCPPWCLTVTATGHTFQPNCETFLPRFKLDTRKLVFPAVNAQEAAYRTIIVENTGTTPLLFDFEKDPNRVFSIKPTKGLLTGTHQVFVVKVLPPSVKTYKSTLRLRLNDAAKNTQELIAWGSAESAEVLLENCGELFFKPTCVGTASVRQYSISNVGRLPLHFEWRLTSADRRLLSVTPQSGTILPNESQFHEWTFVPAEQDKVVMKPALIVWGQGQGATSSAGRKQQFLVRAIGQGSLGDITCDQNYVDLGTVVVGSAVTRQLVLFNDSDCDLHFKLLVEQTVTGPYPEELTRHDAIALSLDQTEGVLPARSQHTVTTTVRPQRRHFYQFSLSYQLLTPNGPAPYSGEPRHLCHVLTTGVFPTLAVTDARCYGSLSTLSKKQLWNLFSLDNLNVCLDADPSSSERMYTMATRHSHRRRPPVYTRAILDFNMGAAPLGSPPAIVHLMLENTGSVPTDWSFMMPQDLQLELEYWAETGEFDEDSLHEMKVMDNKLFAISPKSGRLLPGECKTVTFTYRHDMAGTDRLPVLFKMAQGREVLLNFVGVTVRSDKHYIHFPSSKHMFSPVPIGEPTSPTQVYEMYNGGALPVKYSIDCMPLEVLRQENYDHPVLECLTPYGEVAPGQTVNIEWRFSPLEAKTYMVDVPIRVHNGETALVTFTGVGYDGRVMGDTMPLTENQQLTGVPSVQSVPVPGQLCFLSQERISFGNLPLFSQVRRMIIITNRSQQHPVNFEWHVTSKRDTKVVSISPSRGALQAGQSSVCKITFTAAGLPAFFDIDLVCEVINQTDLDLYQKEATSWEAERQRQSVEFTLTERDLSADDKLRDLEDRPSSCKLIPLDTNRTPTPEGDMGRYKTLPPIRQQSVDEERARLRLEKQVADQFWPHPTPPKPFLLHLGVTARTHHVSEFQVNFAEEYRHYFIDRLLSSREVDQDEAPLKEAGQPVSCLEAEADVVAAALNNILRSLLDDTSFHETVQKIVEEPTPFFQQFTTRRPTVEMAEPPPSICVDTSGIDSASADNVSIKSSDAVLRDAAEELQMDDPSEDVRHNQAHDHESSTTPIGLQATAHSLQMEETFSQRQAIKKTPEFGSIAESFLENTLCNIISEAFSSEFNITARPRLVALPPRPRSATTVADRNNNSQAGGGAVKPPARSQHAPTSKVGTKVLVSAT